MRNLVPVQTLAHLNIIPQLTIEETALCYSLYVGYFFFTTFLLLFTPFYCLPGPIMVDLMKGIDFELVDY